LERLIQKTQMKKDKVLSPLTLNENTFLIKKIKKNKIIKAYQYFNIDVSKYFQDIDYVSLFNCVDTNYKFFSPFKIAGDSSFYEHFQQFSWYYMPWKWEHEVSRQYINSGDKLLEIGCAHGAFLKRINELHDLSVSIGLELNQTSAEKPENYEIINETIQSFSQKNKVRFDLVCSYQVLEHVTDVHSFLSSMIGCLKQGGTLIISVPNNDSFIRNTRSCLNMPPHHVGLWTEDSLRKISELFPLKLLGIHLEPLQEYHIEDYLYSEFYSSYPSGLDRIIRKISRIFGIHYIRYQNALSNLANIKGHSILVAYQKL
jgi:SAM-dependent methyltransferase